MLYKIQIRPLASIEIIEAFDWYEEQVNGLGLKFLDELESFFSILRLNPNTYSYYEKPVREGKIKRFPYQVIYEVVGNSIIVYSVFMSSQNPAKKRIK